MIKQEVVLMQPTIKKDKTATIRVGTIYELPEVDYFEISKDFYDGDTVNLILVKDNEYLDFIISEAKRLTENK